MLYAGCRKVGRAARPTVLYVGGLMLRYVPGLPAAFSRWLAWTRPRSFTPHLTNILVQKGHTTLGLSVVEAHIQSLLQQAKGAEKKRSSACTDSRPIRRNLPAEEPITNEEKAQILGELVCLFESRGWRPFLCFGALLGKIRQNDFLDHDMDLDIGFFYPETQCNDVRECLIAAGYLITKWEPDPWPCRVKARKPGSRLSLDLVFFKEDGEFRLTYARYQTRTLIRKRQSFDLQRTTLRGVNVWMPSNADFHLHENYGDWQNKSSYHHYILTSCLTDFSIPEVRYLLSITLQNALQRGAQAHVDALIKIGAKHYDDDLWRQLRRHVMAGL